MATHDYVIANQSGAAFRSDLNNALAAIVSNNSNSSSPATTYAYQWWADTSANILKLRNSSNNGWINIRELDGTTLILDGSASEPGLAFGDDTDTGIFSSAANTFNVVTGGVERMELGGTTIFNESGADVDFRIEGDNDAALFFVNAGLDQIGIGTDSPQNRMHMHKGDSDKCVLQFTNSATGVASGDGFQVGLTSSEQGLINMKESAPILFKTGDTERFRVDSSGRLLVGTSSGTGHAVSDSNNPLFQVESSSSGDYGRGSFIYNGNDSVGAGIYFAKSRGTSDGSNTVVVSGDQVGGLFFQAADGTDKASRVASIVINVDGTPGSNDTPGRIVFSTTADGASATSERMRITSAGLVGINTDSPSQTLEVNGNISLGNGGSSGGSEMLRIFNDNGVERIHATNNPSGFAFGIGGTGSGNEAFRIDTGEKVLIGITAPPSTGTSGTESAKLQVGISSTSGTAVGFMDTGGFDTNVMVMNHARAGANNGAFTGVMIQFRNGSNTTVGGVSCGSSTTTYSTSSDYRLKENEVLISDGITRLKQLKPYRFNFKITPNITQDGFFAHEAQAVVPQAVTGEKDGMRPETYYEEGEDLPPGKVVGSVKTYSSTEIDIQQLDYSQLVPLLTAALQESISKIEVLETKVAALEAA